jgi:prevent-host-death family protein
MSKRSGSSKHVSTSELKARCSEIVDRVASKRETVIVTRRGRAVARIVPVEASAQRTLFGFARGSVQVRGDILEPIDVPWDALE